MHDAHDIHDPHDAHDTHDTHDARDTHHVVWPVDKLQMDTVTFANMDMHIQCTYHS